MTRGGKPKPTYLRVLQGNASNRPLNKDEPKPEHPLKDPPESLSDRQKDIWRRALAQAPPDLLTSIDESVFKVWVIAYDFHDQANTMVNMAGVFMKTKNNVPIQNPWMAVVNRQSLIMMRAAAEMGFTPSARSRVRVESTQKSGAFSELKELGD
jgi:P27 family predicted phage terminase small subunit